MYYTAVAQHTLLFCVVASVISIVCIRCYIMVDMIVERAWMNDIVDNDVITYTNSTKEEPMAHSAAVVEVDPERMDRKALVWYMHEHRTTTLSRSPIVQEEKSTLPTMYWYTREDMRNDPIAMADDYVIDDAFVMQSGKDHCDALAEVVCRHAHEVTLEDIAHITNEVPAYMRRSPMYTGLLLPEYSMVYSKVINAEVVHYNQSHVA